MRCLQIYHILLSSSLLCSATIIRRDSFDSDNPEASDPTTPPKKLSVPARPDSNFRTGYETTPSSCTDFQAPSQRCIQDLQAQKDGFVAFSGGQLKWDKDHGCTKDQMEQYKTAASDAQFLASLSNTAPGSDNERDMAIWKTWMGTDYSAHKAQIAVNFKRASDLEANRTYDIILSCKDKKSSSDTKNGMAIGGYAWTYNTSSEYQYYYIVMCEQFWKSNNLTQIIDQIQNELALGKIEKAQQAVLQKNTGQYFLHGMMQFDAVGIPKIDDEHVDSTESSSIAYGPSLAYQLASQGLNRGNAAAGPMTNADSYAWLTNSKLFYNLTGYFPQPPNYKNKTNIYGYSDEQWFQELDGWFLNYGTISGNTTDIEMTQRFNDIADSVKTPSPPPRGRTLFIALFQSHGMQNQWRFFTTSLGHAVGCNYNSDQAVKQLSPMNSINPAPDASSDQHIPWPGGDYLLNVDGELCHYKCDGTNPGRLFCPHNEFPCQQDSRKDDPSGGQQCGSITTLHAAVYCDF